MPRKLVSVRAVSLCAVFSVTPTLSALSALPALSALSALPALSALSAPSALSAQSGLPATGTEVLTRMHDAYAGKWYRTLTFQQRTTIRMGDSTRVETWYETIRAPSSLRIDMGDPAVGNGALFTPDTTYVVRNGQVTNARPEGNVFLPLIEAVYVQPVAQTVKDLAQYKFNLQAVHAAHWDGRPVWVVGARSAADSTSPQFWVDTERLVLVRMRLEGGGDVHLGGIERVGGGWLATRVEFQLGNRHQLEEYANWKADPPISNDLFDLSKWKTAPHWVKH